ncbi:MFS transporter [Bradyrhizobium sp. CB1015]|uniref:MFS transporter n=1 Tax=Bradyrhizobium sp. CB1015 TaxID=2976822 RepID=UPI0021AAEA33|nr:MFS transporter [Bradyrhizobium sp. CB1015]UWU93230.1 MFS transporter [Bradyrhizobium sp. CB1015]
MLAAFKEYPAFVRDNLRLLAFGCALIGLSSFGQSYVISLFAPQFRSAFAMTDGEFAAWFAGVTLVSAVTFPWLGSRLTRNNERRFTLLSALTLASAAFAIALSPNIAIFLLGLYLARLGGQGLLVHASLTIPAARLPEASGKAVGVVLIGLSLSQATLPTIAVSSILVLGWRATWALAACSILLIAVAAVLLLPEEDGLPPHGHPRPQSGGLDQSVIRKINWKVFFVLPALFAESLAVSALIFHQARLAETKHWPLEWVAACFVAYSSIQIATTIIAGPLVDRFGPLRIVPFLLVPQAIALLLIFLFSSWWIAPFYFGFTAISAGLDSSVQTPALARLFGVERLARSKARFEGLRIILTGLGPTLMGVLLDLGVPIQTQIGFMIPGLCVFSLLALAFRRAV